MLGIPQRKSVWWNVSKSAVAFLLSVAIPFLRAPSFGDRWLCMVAFGYSLALSHFSFAMKCFSCSPDFQTWDYMCVRYEAFLKQDPGGRLGELRTHHRCDIVTHALPDPTEAV